MATHSSFIVSMYAYIAYSVCFGRGRLMGSVPRPRRPSWI